ncbi:hypothetical protein IMG5_168380 [Ichthyophthirius multifiliis]|uniref:RCC1-like domain-containing protein n=1 Tax=Ichthyophthirius multifiliis TaxID=5932 RepID=G0R135_ICHMU|nr:hypothetical protein IMG5_168380 [Ichthyophthirius multifiliis]EGR28802.1 hypothetical protein IMG5_168380 [Ichthyophthirius multifiliis]|eukprot:XP_004030038.1 hypothetical protein IMG5_168380 [Ichthyophthirius multifiliis]
MEQLNYFKLSQIWVTGSGSTGLLLQNNLDDIYEFKVSQIDEQTDQIQIQKLEINGMMGLILTIDGKVYKYGESEFIKNSNKINILQIPKLIQENQKIKNISCGWHHALLIDFDNNLYGFGSNKFGEIGKGENNKRNFENPQFIFQLNGEYILKCGFRQSIIIEKQQNKQQKVYCTGQNKFFELGGFIDKKILYQFEENKEINFQIKQISCGYKFVCALDYEGNLFGWGDNKYGQLTGENIKYENIIKINENVKEMCTGWNHILVLKDNNEIYCIGRGDLGQQGNNKLENSNQFHQIQKIQGNVQLIQCGSECNYLITSQGLYVWGWNEHGNLGTGNTQNVLEPLLIYKYQNLNVQNIISGGAVCYLKENRKTNQQI